MINCLTRILFCIPIFGFLIACDCYTEINGKVISSANGLPIEGASVELLRTSAKAISGQDGGFSLTYVSGFCPDREK